jgi:isoquinoline 1-oxidoreductase beta subunit
MRVSRRAFLETSAEAAGALILGLSLPGCARGDAPTFRPNAWLRITPDDRITVLVEKPELGQGARTYTPMMIAEELEADWSTIRVEQAPTIPSVYQNLRTGGSGGVESIWTAMRQAGAQARELLRTAAAQRWRVPKSECRAEHGAIVHTPTARRARYGELVGAASRLPLSNPEDIPLKSPKDFRVIGRSIPRTDVPAKVNGTAIFGIDARVPEMLYAVIARCPYFGGTLDHFDATRAKATPGVRAVFPVPPLPRRYNTAGGVAVVADSTWAALEGRKALVIAWHEGAGAHETTASLRQALEQAAAGPPTFVAYDRGDAGEALRTAARTLEASYESPFQAHATMEPMNTTVHVRDGEVEVWSPTQFGDELQRAIAALAGVRPEQVIVHMMLAGGSFGRRYQWDFPAEAWQVAKQMRRPVQLLFSREDDMQHDFYRPYNYQRLRGGWDASGRLIAWSTCIVTTPISGTNLYTSYEETPERLRDPETLAALEWYGSDVAPYAIPNFRVDYAPVHSVVPRSWWRSVSSSFTPFAKECFIDELAHAVGRDPLQFRLDLLSDPSPESDSVRRVLLLAAERAGWGRPLPRWHGRGIAWRAGGSATALVAEVSVDADGTVHVLRLVNAVDCGIAVSPDGVRAMLEGGNNFGLTAALTGEITIKGGAVEQSNFHDYQVLRFDRAPDIEVHIVPGGADPTGVGELGVMLVGPAVANAVFAATGVRVRRLPIDPHLLKRAST